MTEAARPDESAITRKLRFEVEAARPERYAAVPTLIFVIRVEQESGTPIHTIALRCQIRIEPNRRGYSYSEERRLEELFGKTPRWGDTMKPFLWTNVSHLTPAFDRSAAVELPVPCTYDLEIAASKYFHSLDDGEIPLLFLFSGTFRAQCGRLPGQSRALACRSIVPDACQGLARNDGPLLSERRMVAASTGYARQADAAKDHTCPCQLGPGV
jgi:hypothetical protein